jgi:hypothetical protein
MRPWRAPPAAKCITSTPPPAGCSVLWMVTNRPPQRPCVVHPTQLRISNLRQAQRRKRPLPQQQQRMSEDEFLKQANYYIQRAGDAVESGDDERLWLNLARECINMSLRAQIPRK